MLLKKLVIAEDDDGIAHLVAASLGDAGFLCLRARNGEEALALVRTEQPDALILDVMMPKMDGIQVCTRLKEDVLLSRIPILMLTSLASVDDKVAGLEAGADDYLPKPFDIRELSARVRALVRQSRRERDRNPTTNLPGSEAIEDQVESLLRAKRAFSLIYFDLENFRSYADVYGFHRANEVVAHTGKILLEQARAISDPPAFVGHMGGDDFVVICTHDQAGPLCLELREAFLQSVSGFYTEEDWARGHLAIAEDDGEVKKVSFLNPSMANITVSPGQFKSTDELALEVTRTKAKVRKQTRSGALPKIQVD